MKITKIVAAIILLGTAAVTLGACCHKQAPAPATTGRCK